MKKITEYAVCPRCKGGGQVNNSDFKQVIWDTCAACEGKGKMIVKEIVEE